MARKETGALKNLFFLDDLGKSFPIKNYFYFNFGNVQMHNITVIKQINVMEEMEHIATANFQRHNMFETKEGELYYWIKQIFEEIKCEACEKIVSVLEVGKIKERLVCHNCYDSYTGIKLGLSLWFENYVKPKYRIKK